MQGSLTKFSIDHTAAFRWHDLSVSAVIVTKDQAYCVYTFSGIIIGNLKSSSSVTSQSRRFFERYDRKNAVKYRSVSQNLLFGERTVKPNSP